MDEWLSEIVGWFEWLEQYPSVYISLSILLLVVLAVFSNWVTKYVLLTGLTRLLQSTPIGKDELFNESRVIVRLANVVPALVLSYGVVLIPHLPEVIIQVVNNVAVAFIILTVALAISNFLGILNRLYERRPDASMTPIKGYVQVIKIVIYVIATLLVIATLIDRSPFILLSGLGAMAAVLMLVFQDTLLSLVASMQISSNDIVRIGDWVEMPHLNADGDVIDISLHVVKVQNWDKTITTIPTRRFIDSSFKNWRGMQQAGGRRMMRNIMIDQQSIRFLSAEDKDKLKRFSLLRGYLEEKQKEIDDWNKELEVKGEDPCNSRRLTNIGTFRAYVQLYLKHHPGIHQELFMLVRQLGPTADGLPLQVYAFSNDTAWGAYEGIQSDIFDHLYSVIADFGLRVFQHPSGIDLVSLRVDPKTTETEQQSEQAKQLDAEDLPPERDAAK
ncbi:mechanosensitive ion channel protein MscS [Aliidiomarina minuta]|uniref:Mechanosensitive ion channel protein MscS n=1 Tax=Aliidiomarina minuta TaxID=880057 RepID=A0A432WAB8_9GAMM|nr:mechanosensitive ion channel family protein [Aliidiomarina minuta]RUO27052.1 mechanosensitive ion channel protein MscS [Aliidiomarina minuta]